MQTKRWKTDRGHKDISLPSKAEYYQDEVWSL
jgi:hypothetical protein